MTNDDIARQLNVSVNIIKTHAPSIYRAAGLAHCLR